MTCADLSQPADRIRQLEADNARLTGKLTAMSDRSSRLTRDTADFRSFLSRDVVSPTRTQRLEDDCRNLQLKVNFPVNNLVIKTSPKKLETDGAVDKTSFLVFQRTVK